MKEKRYVRSYYWRYLRYFIGQYYALFATATPFL